MENSGLNGMQIYVDLFRQSVLEDIPYWQAYLNKEEVDTPTLKRKREQIIRNIQFALDLEEAGWQPVQSLIEAFSSYMERWGQWSQWQQVLMAALKTAHYLDDKPGEVNLSVVLARLLQWQGRFGEAVARYRGIIYLARQIDDLFNEARSCSNLCFLYTGQGCWWRAEILGCYALTLFNRLENNYGRAHTENHLGFLYTRLHQWGLAQQHLERACTIWQEMADQAGLMRGFINLGALYLTMEKSDQALFYLEKALDQAQVSGNQVERGRVYTNLSIAYRLKGEPAQAEAYARQAERFFRECSSLIELAFVWNSLGLACLDQGKWQEADMHQAAALEAWRSLRSKRDEFKTQLYLVEGLLARNNKKEAAVHLNELEATIQQYDSTQQDHLLQQLLTKYRRSLTELS